MNIKQLKEELNKFPEDQEIYIAFLDSLSFPIEKVEEITTLGGDNIIVIKS